MASGNKIKDTALVRGVVVDMLDVVMKQIKERKKKLMAEYPSFVVPFFYLNIEIGCYLIHE